jgi:LPXTG-site transpeptidase (sortase) family protein
VKINSKLKVIVAAVLLAGVVMALCYFVLLPKRDSNKVVNPLETNNSFGWKYPESFNKPHFILQDILASILLAYSKLRDPAAIPLPIGLPVRLKIPVIGVDALVEDALITEGRMDMTEGSVNVAWFALGPKPGEVGSAVIGGHYGISNGVKYVFYDLNKLVVGDKVYVINDKGETLAFQVRSIKLFNRFDDTTDVFNSSDGLAHLNIITCEGIWNQTDLTYESRRVVFTDAIPFEPIPLVPTSSPAVVKIPDNIIQNPSPVVFSRSLRLGSSGADVAALQDTLVKNGFLIFTPRMVKGYFGTATRAALGRYQASIGLRADGVLGPVTRAKIISNESQFAVKPALPSTSITESQPSNSSPKSFTQSIKNLFSTPLDGIITSIFISVIIFLVFKLFSK